MPVVKLADDYSGPFDSDICGNDASNRENSQKISTEKEGNPFVIRVHWKLTAADQPRLISCYQLDLRRLLAGNYMYRDPDGSPRLKIQHDGGEFYIRRKQTGPSVRLD